MVPKFAGVDQFEFLDLDDVALLGQVELLGAQLLFLFLELFGFGLVLLGQAGLELFVFDLELGLFFSQLYLELVQSGLLCVYGLDQG